MKRILSTLPAALAVSAAISFSMLAAVGTLHGQTPKSSTAPASDVKIRQRMTMAGSDRGTETVMYVKGSRMRSEMATTGMSMMTVRQCDLKRTIMINDKTRMYFITPDGANGTAGDGGAIPGVPGSVASQTPTRRGGIVNITSTITDTGERKEMFGFTARRIKTSMVKDASPDACDKGNNKIETDGWYIDYQLDFYCPTELRKVETPGVISRPDCQDEIRTKSIGKARLGFPVLMTTTVYGADGQVASTLTNEVLELSRSPLDAALFDVPAGYSLAKNYLELYGMSMGDGGAVSKPDRPASGSTQATSSIPISSAASTLAGFVAASSPKKAGASRIGIVMPKAQMTSGDSIQAASALRSTFASYLNSPNIELVALNARLPSQALEEAKQSNCDYILYSSLTQKKGSAGMFSKALGNIASSAVGHLPGGSNAGEAVARSVAVTTVYTAADVSAQIKSKDELTLEYKLESLDAARPPVANTAKAKAKSDGEDVFSPLVEKAAQAVVDAVRAR
jgi:hypothetical protein